MGFAIARTHTHRRTRRGEEEGEEEERVVSAHCFFFNFLEMMATVKVNVGESRGRQVGGTTGGWGSSITVVHF